jgi:hypothetical protein
LRAGRCSTEAHVPPSLRHRRELCACPSGNPTPLNQQKRRGQHHWGSEGGDWLSHPPKPLGRAAGAGWCKPRRPQTRTVGNAGMCPPSWFLNAPAGSRTTVAEAAGRSQMSSLAAMCWMTGEVSTDTGTVARELSAWGTGLLARAPRRAVSCPVGPMSIKGPG